ncbi:MAG: DUF2062 domain-containing protein [Nitrospinales bacterium]
MKAPSLLKEKIISPLIDFLKQGLSPTKLALVIALGMVISVFPIVGTTTLLCTVVALVFRLNLPAIQVANYIAFPLQIILFFPFLRIGERISGISLSGVSESTLISAFNGGFFQAISDLSQYLVFACFGWALASIPLFFILYFIFRVIFNRLGKSFSSSKALS